MILPRKAKGGGERKGERWKTRLERGKTLNIKVPTCLDAYPAFTEGLNHLRNHFGNKLVENQVMKGGRMWMVLSLERQ